MNKRGQVTLFVVLGILIVIIIATIFFLRTLTSEQAGRTGVTTTLALSNVKNRVDSLVNLCFTEFSDSIIYEAGEHGGYAVIEANYWQGLPYGDGWGTEDHPQYLPLVYLQCGDVSLMPDLSDVERSIENSIGYSLANLDCLRNFDDFKIGGWGVEGTKIDVIADVNENGISLELNIPRTFTKDDKSFDIDNYHYSSNVAFPFYLEKAEEIISGLDELLLDVGPDLFSRISSGELTEEEAAEEARNQVDTYLDGLDAELDSEGYLFIHITSLDPPPECSQNPELFLIKNRENNFRFVFGASL